MAYLDNIHIDKEEDYFQEWFDPLVILEEMGKGAYATVLKGVYTVKPYNDGFVALKCIRYKQTGDFFYKVALKEAKIMKYIENMIDYQNFPKVLFYRDVT